MTSKASSETSLPKLFSQLELAGEEGDYEWASDIVDEILTLSPNDPDALHCKVICLIQLSEYDDAIKLIDKLNKKADSCGFVYEKAYCYYKKEQYELSLNMLNGLLQDEQSTVKVLDLRAQVLYRVERFQESAEAFSKSRKLEDSQERSADMAAALSYCPPKMANDMMKLLPIATDTVEQCFNVATVYLQSQSDGDVERASELLERACVLCRDVIDDEEELEQEMIPINTQLAYCLHRRGNIERAMALYVGALKARPSNPVHTTIIANNLLVLNKDKDIFDSKKKVKLMSNEEGLKKLTSVQSLVVLYNKCIFALQTNQLEHCRQHLSQMKDISPSSDLTKIADAALLYREKKVSEAIKVLSGDGATGAVLVYLTLAELHATQGNYAKVREVLEGVPDIGQYLGVVSALVSHYVASDRKDSAMKLLDTVFRWWKERKDVAPPICYKVLWDIAVYELQCGVPQGAVAILEHLRGQVPGEVKYLAYLIYCYAQFDTKKAEELGHTLPQFTPSIAIDVDSLEQMPSFKHTRRQVAKSMEKKETNTKSQEVKVKRKKHKPRLPKNHDPAKHPDPERWLPLRERSYYRKGKKKNQASSVGRGTQGASAATASIAAKLDASRGKGEDVPSPSTTSPRPTKPKQQQQQRKQQQKKKKGKR